MRADLLLKLESEGAGQKGTQAESPPQLTHADEKRGVSLYVGNCLEYMDLVATQHPEGLFDVIFADPPYFLSNGGITCQSGKMVKVDKGQWDKSQGSELNHQFNYEWLRRCQKVLKPNGSIWVTGTHHVIFSAGFAMQQLGYKILNNIAWEKPNPPPNLSCRYFTHSIETVIWAARDARSKHVFNYKLMRQFNGGKQMKTVWKIAAPGTLEKSCGKHPTQKPVALVERALLACSREGDLVFDPFAGSGTTAVAAIKLGRKCIAIDLDRRSIQTASKRVERTARSTIVASDQKRLAVQPGLL